MTPEELNELTDKSFLDPVVMSGNYFTEFEDEALNRKEKIYNTALETKPAVEISALDQEVNDRDAVSFKIVPEDVSEVFVGSETKFEAVAIATELDAVPNDPCVTWESSNKDVADFIGNVLNAMKAGETTITATDTYNSSVPVSLEISVKDPNGLMPRVGEFDYIWNEDSWNEAYNKENSALKTYLDRNPDEDRWNSQENRWGWAADKVEGEWPEWCVQCWQGAINAPGAKYPWVVVNLPIPFTGNIELSYEGKDAAHPWGEEPRTFNYGYAIASLPTTFGDEFLLDENGQTTFDPSKFKVTLLPA